jgi:hypothetical protein
MTSRMSLRGILSGPRRGRAIKRIRNGTLWDQQPQLSLKIIHGMTLHRWGVILGRVKLDNFLRQPLSQAHEPMGGDHGPNMEPRLEQVEEFLGSMRSPSFMKGFLRIAWCGPRCRFSSYAPRLHGFSRWTRKRKSSSCFSLQCRRHSGAEISPGLRGSFQDQKLWFFTFRDRILPTRHPDEDIGVLPRMRWRFRRSTPNS